MNQLILRITFALCLVGTLTAFRYGSQVYFLDSSVLYLTGDTNVKGFTCQCEQKFEPLSYQMEQRGESNYQFSATHMRIPIRSLNCGNRMMNRDLFAVLKADQYPNIVIEPLSFDIPQLPTDTHTWVELTAKTRVSLAGVTKAIVLPVKICRLSDERWKIRSYKTLCMHDFGIDPPTAMAGLIKVRDEIDIHFDLVVESR
jgi:hypothetical protein